MAQGMPALAPVPKTAQVAFQYGLIFGLVQAVIASAVLLVNAFVVNGVAGLGLLFSGLSFLTGLAAYFVSGMLAAKRNGKVSTGTFAGMWTGAIYGLIGFVVSMILFFQVSLPNLIDQATATGLYSNMNTFRTGAEIGGVGFAIFGIFFAIGLGTGLGALGGLVGRSISPYKQANMVPVYVQYPAYPSGQPMYPSQPAQAEQVYVEQPAVNPYQNPPQQ